MTPLQACDEESEEIFQYGYAARKLGSLKRNKITFGYPAFLAGNLNAKCNIKKNANCKLQMQNAKSNFSPEPKIFTQT